MTIYLMVRFNWISEDWIDETMVHWNGSSTERQQSDALEVLDQLYLESLLTKKRLRRMVLTTFDLRAWDRGDPGFWVSIPLDQYFWLAYGSIENCPSLSVDEGMKSAAVAEYEVTVSFGR